MNAGRAVRRRGLVGIALLAAVPLPAAAQRLFRKTDPVPVTFTTDLRSLVRNRDSTKFVPFGSVMAYVDDEGKAATMPVTLRARGHFRRQSANCDFPPLLLEFKKQDAEGTLFQGNTKLKITTTCRPRTAEYEQYILAEYALYRVYQVVSPAHFRTRLARVTYKDSLARMADVTTWAFFIEDDKEVAKEYDQALEKRQGARFDDLEPQQLAITALFQYMIGNTDWSVGGLHNVALLRDSTITISTVAYDFDWSGAVNARYAFPDKSLPIKRVVDRLYRGPCLSAAEWQPIFARFTAARPAIDSIYASIPDLDPKRKATTLAYFEQFWKTIANPREAKRELIDPCLSRGN
jgi:hypothetical protein